MSDGLPRSRRGEKIERRRGDLPGAASPIIGRETELGKVERLLDQHRLVSIVGPPGTGKSRLAFEVVDQGARSFSGHTYFVDLAGLSDGAELRRVVADSVLGVDSIARADSAIDRFAHAIRWPTLIVLDNCDHLIPEVADFVRSLLARVVPARCLLTARRPPGVLGEEVLRLGPLSTAVAAGSSPAEALFRQRASTVQRSNPELDRPTVSRICERVDGLPLAIELAASCLDTLTLEELDTRLDEILRSGDETLETAIAWSWDRLSDDEKLALSQVTVFLGDFDSDAFLAVCTFGRTATDLAEGERDPVAMLIRLVDRSFITVKRGSAGNRFRLLAPIRSFVEGRSDQRELAAAAQRHQDHFIELTAPLVAAFDSDPDPGLAQQLELDDHNFVIALQPHNGGSISSARRLAVRLHTYWEETGRLAEGFVHASNLIEPADPTSRSWRSIVGLSISYAAMTGNLPAMAESEMLLAELVGAEGDPAAMDAYMALGFSNLGRGEMAEAAVWFERAAKAATTVSGDLRRQNLLTAGACRAYDDTPGLAIELYGEARRVPPPTQGWFDDYARVFESSARIQTGGPSVDIDRELGAIDRATSSLVELGLGFRVTVAVHQAAIAFELADAGDLLKFWWPVAMKLARANGHRWAAALAVELAGWSSARSGDDRAAVSHWAVADTVFDQAGYALSRVHRRAGEWHREIVSARLDPTIFDAVYADAATIDLAVHIDSTSDG